MCTYMPACRCVWCACVCMYVCMYVCVCFNCLVNLPALDKFDFIIKSFLSPALEQHQYTYWSLSKMASEKKPSCCYSLGWLTICDYGRIGSSYSEWHVIVWHQHQPVEKGITIHLISWLASGQAQTDYCMPLVHIHQGNELLAYWLAAYCVTLLLSILIHSSML